MLKFREDFEPQVFKQLKAHLKKISDAIKALQETKERTGPSIIILRNAPSTFFPNIPKYPIAIPYQSPRFITLKPII